MPSTITLRGLASRDGGGPTTLIGDGRGAAAARLEEIAAAELDQHRGALDLVGQGRQLAQADLMAGLLGAVFHPQAELKSRYRREFLATSEGLSWGYLGNGRFRLVAPGEAGAIEREDL